MQSTEHGAQAAPTLVRSAAEAHGLGAAATTAGGAGAGRKTSFAKLLRSMNDTVGLPAMRGNSAALHLQSEGRGTVHT